MSNTVYTINKGINKPVEFKGLKAQYIWWLGGGILGLLFLFAGLYLFGVNAFFSLGLIGILGTIWFLYVFKMSNTYGEHGMKKKLAARRIPKIVKSHSRKIFQINHSK